MISYKIMRRGIIMRRCEGAHLICTYWFLIQQCLQTLMELDSMSWRPYNNNHHNLFGRALSFTSLKEEGSPSVENADFVSLPKRRLASVGGLIIQQHSPSSSASLLGVSAQWCVVTAGSGLSRFFSRLGALGTDVCSD